MSKGRPMTRSFKTIGIMKQSPHVPADLYPHLYQIVRYIERNQDITLLHCYDMMEDIQKRLEIESARIKNNIQPDYDDFDYILLSEEGVKDE